MKKVLFLIPTLGGGGAERVLCNLVNKINKDMFDVSVQTLFDCGVNRSLLGEEVKYIPGMIKKQFRGNIHVLKFFSPKILYKIFVKEKYDIVVSYLEGPTARIVSGCMDGDTKLVNWIHTELKNKKITTAAYRNVKEYNSLQKCFDMTVCVANSVEESYKKVTQNKCKTTVLYNTVLDDIISENSKEPIEDGFFSKDINIVSVGRLVQEKGFDRLILAHKRLIDCGIKNHIYVIGSGNTCYLNKLIRQNGVDETFHLVGYKSNPQKYVSRADLYVCSSRTEGFSTAVTESLIVGTPVVSTNCSGAYELLGNNNEYGIVVENSENGIYNGIKEMLSNPDLINNYAKKAKERGKLFSSENTTKAVENMFERLFVNE